MSFKLKGLREQRAAVRVKIEAIGTKIKTESRAMSADEMTAFDALKTEWTSLGDQVKKTEDALKALDDILAADAGDGGDPAADPATDPTLANAGRGDKRPAKRNTDGGGAADSEVMRKYRRLAFQGWARAQHGKRPTAEHLAACKALRLNPRAKDFEFRIGGPGSVLSGVRTRAQSTTTTAGGHTIAQDFSGALEVALLDYSSVRGVVGEFTTGTGATFPWPTEDDTGNSGEMLGEGVETAFADDTFSVVNFGSYKFSSKGVLISSELLNDSEFALDTHIGTQIGIRIARAQGPKFTTGTGTAQPKGIVTCSTLGVTSASGTAITPDELTRLAFSLDKAYRDAPGCGYMMHDTVLAYVLLLKDADNRPLFRESYRDGIRLEGINSYPVFTNQYMQAVTTATGLPVTATKSVLFGDMNKFKVRDVGTVRVRRLDERYATSDQVGFVAFMRSDSNCVNTSAIKHLQQA